MLAGNGASTGLGLVCLADGFRLALRDSEPDKRATEVQELINANRQQYFYTPAVERVPHPA